MIHTSPEVTLLVRNYNGVKFLVEYLPSVMTAAEVSQHPIEVLVVDDGSTDDSVEYVIGTWPNVRLVAMKENTGHAPAANMGFVEAKGEIVIALDNDVRVDAGFVDPLVSHFTDDKVFSVNSDITVPRIDNLNESIKLAKFHHGMLYFECVQAPPKHSIPILYSTACAAAYRRSLFLELGGFDSLYPPLYWDDTDLSYRSRKRGYEVMYEPESKVEHWYAGSTAPEKKQKMERRKWENYFLFIWKNLTDPQLFQQHLVCLPVVLAKARIVGNNSMIAGFNAALKRIPDARQARRREQRFEILRDRDILRRFARLPET